MRCIFLDESGDLGFSERFSKFFIITLLLCDEDTIIDLRRIIKKIRTKRLKKKMKIIGELKGNNSDDFIREKVLKDASSNSIEIYSIVLDKSKVFDYLKNKKHKLYNYTANLILNECSVNSGKVKIIADRRSGRKFLTWDFDQYIKNMMKERSKECSIEIKHEDSKNEGALQVLDFICWAIYRKYEYHETYFYDIIKEKIVTEKLMFPGP